MSEGRRRAILIAASEFPEEPSLQTLRCPKNDVAGLAEALTSPDFGLFTDPLTFINEPSYPTLRAINRVFKEASRDDQILIYYSGHGKQDTAGNLHLATADTETSALETSSIAIGTLRRLIDNHACKQVALILDCCFGGAVSKDFLKSGVDDQLKQTFHGRGIYILTASTATQTAREKEGDDYSLFTKHILQGIREGEADHDDDGLISLDDLYEYVKTRVPREAPQYPTKWEFGVQGNSLFIARAVRTYSPDRLRAFREKIKSVDDYLLPEVFDHAYKVIRENQPKRDKEFLALLETLLEGRMTISEFSSHWLKLTSALSPERSGKAPPQLGNKIQPPSPVVITPPKDKPTSHLDDHVTFIDFGGVNRGLDIDVYRVVSDPTTEDSRSIPAHTSFTENLNGVPLEMIFVPGGSFEMGSTKGFWRNNRPQHEVTVPDFFIGKYQITQAQWEAVMDKNPSHFKGDPALPVENISWNEAKEFCKKLAQMTGNAYRLPSEAEWEYACRAGTTGDYAGELDAIAWYSNNSGSRTHPVGQKQPNAFGLYDMHGNILEWCEDVWHTSYKDAPVDGSAWLNGGDPSRRIVRGGFMNAFGYICGSGYRDKFDLSNRNLLLGVRVAASTRALTP
jgi:formylglycine-generating enzyme required for sulfatase activity